MPPCPLSPRPFAGDPDVEALHRFFQPERQYAGDVRWAFGTSLKSAYVNSFEFLNAAPVVQMWRDAGGELQAVSRIMLDTGSWFHQAAPAYRSDEVRHAIARQARDALRLLSDQPTCRTVAYEKDEAAASFLESEGYELSGVAEVFMERSLEADIETPPAPQGCTICTLDADDPDEVFERGDAQVDAFLEGQPREEVAAWMTRSLRHQLGYGRPERFPLVVAMEPNGSVLAFADTCLDARNQIGEFEPVGTRKQARRRGLARAVVSQGLALMKAAGMKQAVVRTGIDNAAAIATYRSVGFEITDRLLSYRLHFER